MPEPTQEQQVQDPWYIRAARRAGFLRRKQATPEEVEAARAGAERLNQRLPDFASGRAAVLKKRAQYEAIDKAMEEANR